MRKINNSLVLLYSNVCNLTPQMPSRGYRGEEIPGVTGVMQYRLPGKRHIHKRHGVK